MKKPKSTRGKAGTKTPSSTAKVKADKPVSSLQPSLPFPEVLEAQAGRSHEERAGNHPQQVEKRGTKPHSPSSPSPKATVADDIPEDALPPPRPEPILSLKLSAALHVKLRHQAQDEGITVEALAQEMLAEGVVLRAWEIMERKSAMRGGTQSGGFNQHSNGGNRPNYGTSHSVNGNTKHPRPHYGASSNQGNYGHSGRNQNYQSNQGRNQNQAWMEDRAAFLEYVRNQEKRGRR